ncbi:sugar ABC transporter permease [bacterium 1XD8-76]|nr:sugar ABC transporter permease [bacterium 1XD8-76]
MFYLTPWIIGFLAFQLYPLVMSFLYSFTDFTMLNDYKFVGLQNYIKIFTNDRLFLKSMKATFMYVAIALPLKMIISLFIAGLLNQKLKGISIFKVVYYLPSIFGGSVAITILWRFIFMKTGLLNTLIGAVFSGYKAFDWIGSPKTSLPVISLLQVWQFGSSMVLFLAGLKQVPDSLYEAADIDGANAVQKYFRITLPMLSPIILFNLVMQMIQLFQDFTAAFVITGGGALKETYLYGLMLYENGFRYFKMGYASAQSWILFVIIILFTFTIFRLSDGLVHYED